MAKKRSKKKSSGNSGGGNYQSSARKTQQRISLAFGLVLTFAMVASLILPLLTQGFANSHNNTIQPTATAAPTLPAPPAPEEISFDETYLHPSGLFTVALPDGWEPGNSNTTATEAQAQLENPDVQSIIELRMIEPQEEFADAAALDTFFTDSWLGASWRNYTTWSKDTQNVVDDKLVMDFSLSQGASDYIARQVSYLQDDRIYVARVVTLPNASDTLRFVLDELVDSFAANEQFLGGAVDWSAYFDSTDKHIIRYPQAWTLTDSAPGLPATIAGDNSTLRVESADGTLDDESAVEAFISAQRTGTDVLTVEAIERGDYSGWQATYQVSTLDGAPESGLAIILNTDEKAHVASLRVSDDVDFSSDDAAENYADVLAVLESFTLFPELDIAPTTTE